MKTILLITAMMTITGCSTIHFDNGIPAPNPSSISSKWHHNVALGLMEISQPVNLKKECQSKQWSSVKTELSATNGLASIIINSALPLWYPKTVTISCQ